MLTEQEQRTIDDAVGYAETLIRSEGGAIVAGMDSPDTDERALIDALPLLGRDGAADVTLGETLGEGGMGLVRLAEQRAIGRKVAVKSIRPEQAADERLQLQLLREAWVTGALEHPNVVPIYGIGVDENGSPMIVMKRIDGRRWSTAIYEDQRDLKWHLRILMQVASAVEVAGSQDIVHRDIKPDNVMIGPFGEVYVLDWGIAVGLGDDRGGRIPLAKEVRGVSGTPGYIAPEMVAETGEELCLQTDVYLLGAVLHELITKTKRHMGKDLRESLASSMISAPFAYSVDVPIGLAEIANRATAREPSERYESARDFREAIEEFLSNDSSRRLSGHAKQRLGEWDALGDDADPMLVQGHFAACRFGFIEALRSWPENAEAEQGLRTTLLNMFEFELGRDHVDAADLLLAELAERPTPRPDLEPLRARVDKRRGELAALKNLQQDRDLSVGRRTRAFLALLTAISWGGLPIALWFAQGAGMAVDYAELYAISALKLLPAPFILWWARDSLSKTAVNQQLTATAFVAAIIEIGVRPFAARLGHPFTHSLYVDFGIYIVAFAVLTITVDRRLFFGPLAYALGATFAYHDPDRVLVALGASHFVAFLSTAAVWRPSRIIGPYR